MDNQLAKKFLCKFGERLSTIRKRKKLNYRELAQLCTIDYSDISKIEKGRVSVQILTVLELANALEVRPKELFEF